MRCIVTALVATALAAGCGGNKEEGECGEITLDVTVADAAGNPIEGADVNIDNETPCAESGGGAYSCTLPGPGEYNLYALKLPDYAGYGSLITATCDASPMSMSVTLSSDVGGV